MIIEMLPMMINVSPQDDGDDVPIAKKTQPQPQQLNGFDSTTSRRVRRNYLIMIAVAYALTLSCEGTGIILWTSSSKILSCGNNNSSSFGVSNNATMKTVTSTSAETKNYHGIEESDYDYSSNKNITTTKIDDNDYLSRQSLDKKCMIYNKWRRIHVLSLMKLTICTIMLIVLFLNLQGM
jgi:hypothetical protein